MNLKQGQEYRNLTRKRPNNFVLGSNEPMQINEIILYADWRVKIIRELTREEFVAQVEESAQKGNAVRGVTTVENNRLNLENEDDVPGIPEYRHYYKGELHL